MEDPVFKQKYQKYKLRVKLWEKDFKKKHGRIPSKYDIREASQEIRDSYKMYYKLKTSFLEDTLNDVLSDDGFDVLEMSQRDGDMDVSLTESITDGPQLPLDISKLVEQQKEESDCKEHCNGFSNIQELPSGYALTNLANRNENHVLKEFEPVEVLPLNDKAWGPNVAMKPEIKEKKELPRKSLKPNFKEKLFQNTSFSKRNPRKSLSKSALDSSLRGSQTNLSDTLNTSNKEVLPDLETILLQKAKEQQAAAIIAANPLLAAEKTKENIKTHVDEGWLERNAVQNGIKTKANVMKKVQKVEENNNHCSLTPNKKSIYGLSNIDVSKFQTTSTDATTVQTPTETNETTPNNLNSNMESETTDTPYFQEMPLDQTKKTQAEKNKSHDSDSVVDDSEEEKEPQEYRHIVKRRRIIASTSPKAAEKINNNHTEKPDMQQDVESSVPADVDLEKDFSPDSEKDDEDYVQEKPKARRKKAVAKRKTSAKPKASPKSKKTKEKSPKEKKPKAATRTSKKKGINIEELPNEEELETQPLNPEDLKYTLALERGDITSVPRIKQTDLDKADNLAQQYINTMAPMPGTTPSSKPIPVTAAEEKRAAARRKLEEKVASGKLNENFVTINIQKKTFVRGKKSVNYSKYKKKLWKHKKHIAALSGPNMDMGGCDGGTLKCFNCGQAGHFAQNCKVKGDSLLPLTAQLEEDPSPFPTLEEAERMASQSAVAVHSRNISKLPQAANAAIYNQMEQSDSDDNESDEVKVCVNNSDDEGSSDNEDQQKGDDEILMETDDELEDFDVDLATSESQKTISPIKKYVGSKIPDEFLKAAGIDPTNPNSSNSTQFGGVGPLYDLNADGSVKELTDEVLEALKMFGHTSFRKGQDRAVMRILSGMSTLVTLSTGSGKSLCYQLPAYLYSKHKKSITLVISPLVSLMEDQVTGVPHFLRAHCLHTNQTPQQKVKILKMIADGEIDVLLVSPEAVVAGERSTGFGSILRQLPPIAFACIDEAHCVSQWSHNFRPSYLMICKVLKQNLGVKCVLGLTATATLPTRMSIINHLGITDGERGIISDIPLPDNLILSVSKDENRDSSLLQLLLSKRFEACQSIIIYCTRRDECERIAGYLRTCLQDRKVPEPENGKKKRKRVNWHAEPYHAGMPASRRRTIQNAFMSNELRIVVATIAFGMGINKPDIRAVIHYNMPRNFESYVQEVGRAGRDNKISHCHLFLDANGGDQNELKRHIYANSLDRHVIRKLLQRIFVPCSCDKNLKDGVLKSSSTGEDQNASNQVEVDASDFGEEGKSKARKHICPGHEIGFSIEKTVEALDIPEENISTLLCYMELDNRWCINVLSNAYIKAKVISYGGPKYLKHAAKECPPLAMAIAMEIKNGSFKEDANIIEFSVVDVAAAIGWNSGVVKYQLKNLEWVQVNGYSKRSPITVSFYDLGFRIKAPGDFTAEEIDDALDTLYNRSVKQEQTQLIQLQYVFQGLSSVAYNSYGPCCNETFSHDRSDQLKGIIRDYFRNDYPKNLKLEIDPSNISDGELESDVIALINMYPENNFSGRNIARIFHGISSPNYPAVMWYRCKFWRVHSKTDFNRIVQLANNVIVRRRT
ncbi:ATP-dependent DNA helicase Q4 [Lucilia cuprina]|uniref:ATP-dependent DNA helicase Q4 n=1 Tax=Lucilia cuprina TaxID=7375 RepID=UPI001F05A6C4|nr:ATP-dependent DNA helicase Q4 [Lucilia cuprina]